MSLYSRVVARQNYNSPPNNPFKKNLLDLTDVLNRTGQLVVDGKHIFPLNQSTVFVALSALAKKEGLTLGLETTSAGAKCIVGDISDEFSIGSAKITLAVNSTTNLSPIPPSILKLTFGLAVSLDEVSIFVEGVKERLKNPRNPNSSLLVSELGFPAAFDLLVSDELLGHFVLTRILDYCGSMAGANMRMRVPLLLSDDPRFALSELIPFLGSFIPLLSDFDIDPNSISTANVSKIREFGELFCNTGLYAQRVTVDRFIHPHEIGEISKLALGRPFSWMSGPASGLS